MKSHLELPVAARTSWDRLIAGNKRFKSGTNQYPNTTRERRIKTVQDGQHPFAVILTCSDSRVPPELLFDAGIGDLFVIRVAGNVIDKIILGSIEYAVKHLETPLIVVLGHSHCGAVTGACAGSLEGNKKHLELAIKPAIDAVGEDCDDLVDAVIRENTRLMALRIRASDPFIRPACDEGETSVMAAYYDLESGEVTVLD